RRARVAGGGAHDGLGTLPHGDREGHGHAAVLEGAGGVVALDLEPHLGAGHVAEPVGGHHRCAALTQGDRRGALGDVQAVAVLLEDAAPLVAHSGSPSTRITDDTSRTLAIARRASTVAERSASLARWETTTSWASSPRPSWRTV